MLAIALAAALVAGPVPAQAQTPAAAPAPLYVIIYRQGPAWDTKLPMRQQPAMGRHGAYMKRLFDEGHTFAAGPTDAPGGIVILRAANREEAAALMAQDPSITSGMFVGEILPWTPAFRSDKPLP
jgi:uncharacterized protein YciI